MAVTKNGTLLAYRAGTADDVQLEAAISEAWREALKDPKERTDVAKTLGLPESELDPARPPFEAEITGSGFVGGEVLILVATAFAAGFVKDIASDAGKKAAEKLRELWKNHMSYRVSPPGSGKLGGPKNDDKEEDG
jgi:hypothetical protein